jgi:serine/threonine protein kinase
LSLEPGQRLSHYSLVERIGEGGMGVVWKALDTTLDREAKLLASLNHPHIAGIHGGAQIVEASRGPIRLA